MRKTLRYLATAATLLTAAAPLAVPMTPADAQPAKPNILFIMGDDIGWMQEESTTKG
jgi:ABC-type sugar transport system substrate-binding protein